MSWSDRLPPRARLDAELVRRGIVVSRAEAKRAIEEGKVVVAGVAVPSPATLVTQEVSLKLVAGPRPYVSRGGEKLDGALRRLGVTVAGRRWLDAGASTGGFTDRLLQGGALAVVAVDVGYGQLDWRLRADPRVVVLERVNVRTLARDLLPFVPDAIVGDLSFISLTLVLPALTSVAGPGADLVLLVKPQFEVGKDLVGKGGVVRDPGQWRSAIHRVSERAGEVGLALVDAAPSLLPGPAGNREFFVHLRQGSGVNEAAIESAIEEVA